MVTRMITKGRPCWRPISGSQSQSAWSFTSADWPRPMATPAAAVTTKDSKPPTSAAARAGTIRNVISAGDRRTTPAPDTRITAAPARAPAIIQLRLPTQSGDTPSSTAPFSFSAAARVLIPNRVQREIAHRPAVATTVRPSSQKRSRGMVVPSTSTGRAGSTRSVVRPVAAPAPPKRMDARASR